MNLITLIEILIIKSKKQKVTEKELDCKFARNKHGENDFNIFKAYTHTHLKII